jgi:hypothetical protein
MTGNSRIRPDASNRAEHATAEDRRVFNADATPYFIIPPKKIQVVDV